MLDRGQYLAVRHLVAAELVGDDHPRHILQALEQLTEESIGGVAISVRLDQHIEHVAVLIDRAPQIIQFAVDADEDLVKVPCVTGPWAPTAGKYNHTVVDDLDWVAVTFARRHRQCPPRGTPASSYRFPTRTVRLEFLGELCGWESVRDVLLSGGSEQPSFQ